MPKTNVHVDVCMNHDEAEALACFLCCHSLEDIVNCLTERCGNCSDPATCAVLVKQLCENLCAAIGHEHCPCPPHPAPNPHSGR